MTGALVDPETNWDYVIVTLGGVVATS
jgi:hypothetical protein